MKTGGQLSSKAIGHRVSTLQDRWRKLGEMAATRKARLRDAAQAQQVLILVYSMLAENTLHILHILHM